MGKDKIVSKVFVNKNNKQFTVVIPKKKLKAICPTIKPNDALFVELKLVRGKK